MAINGIAFDCCWLMDLESSDFDQQYAAMQLVDRMVKLGVDLLLDHEQRIDKEYFRNISGRTVGGRIVEKLKKSAAFTYVSGIPKAACLAALNADEFDPSDLPYVGAAQNGHGVLITSEEKHLVPERCALIKRTCKVVIVGSADVPNLLM